MPVGDLGEEVGDEDGGHDEGHVPPAVREYLQKISLEHPGRGHEQPVGRVHHLHVCLMV